MKRFPRASIITLFVLAVSPSIFGQGKLEDYQRAERFLPGNLQHVVYVAEVSPHWIEKTNRFFYRKASPSGSEFVLIDPEHNTRTPAFDHVRLATALSHAAKQDYSASDLPFTDFEFVDDAKAIRFSIDKAQWNCSLATYECHNDQSQTERANEALSPNKRWAAFVKEYNLYLRDVSTGTVLQLTHDGTAAWDYATPLPSLRLMIDQGSEDVQQRPGVSWSPDSSKLVTYRIDSRNSGRFTSLQFVPPEQLRPRAFTYVYPLPGEFLAKATPVIFDIQSGKRIDVNSASIELPFQDGPGFDWAPDGKSFRYDYDDRGFKAKELRVVDATTGEQRVLLREQSDTYVDPGETMYRFVEATGEILWTSERDGWNHLYLYSKTGQLENQVTQGTWVIRNIESVDEKNRRVYFSASGRETGEDPYQTHLYSVGLDGKDLQLLSPGKANHSVSVSPDGSFFVDSYSRPDLPGESALRRTKDGSEVRVLEKAEAAELTKTGWKFPEPFQGKAADGSTDLYGLIWRPSNFDSSKKYPIVEFVYTGPQSFFVPKDFGGTLRLQSMAELGFVVVMIDGRGTTGRSRVFHQFSYRNLGGAFEDHVAMIKQMASRFPYMDLTRVGIYGTSAGGYGAAHAMLAFPEFYRVGVSTSGDHDARLDKAWWNELYQGFPVQEDYVAQSNVTMASRLQGHLLLEHGDIDENVHPVETMRFVDALMKANKNFDMLLVPNMFHGESGEHRLYLVRRRWDYFVQYLLGVTPPANFEIKEDQEPGRSGRRRRR
ncbi:MAG TPA: DPP IV N-terminal domain-containing protein [Candidatus Solibacter sp.]|nr:DPP IV N-terminal domain-containing protein [Candidatus Solibacter sp.]